MFDHDAVVDRFINKTFVAIDSTFVENITDLHSCVHPGAVWLMARFEIAG